MNHDKNKNILDKVSEQDNVGSSDDDSVNWIPEEIKIVPDMAKGILNKRELSDYRNHREKLLEWTLIEGKNPEEMEGYAESTMKPHAYRIDGFYRFVWDEEREYTTEVTHEHVEQFIRTLKQTDDSDSHKSKCVDSLKILFRWRHHELDEEMPDIKNPFSSGGSNNPKDYLTSKERERIRQAAYEHGRIPVEDKSEEGLEELRTHLAQRFGVKKDEVCIEELRSWKVPSLVEVSLDTGLRPCEVEKASVEWIDLENNRMMIPMEESSKNSNNWETVISESTAETLEKWLKEREDMDMYEKTDKIWLTSNDNPYNKNSLRDLMHRLFEKAGIDKEGRQASWYTIRHSTGTYLSEDKGLQHTTAQLRHDSKDTTKAYVHPPVEKRKEGIESLS
jgi:site-specific recombinase XerD